MSILLKILLGLLILLAILVVGVFVAYFVVIALHERHWRNLIDDNYDDREKENAKKN